MRNYLRIDGTMALIPFLYPEDREVEIGTELVVEVALSRDIEKSISKTVKVRVTDIIKQENKRRIVYECYSVENS